MFLPQSHPKKQEKTQVTRNQISAVIFFGIRDLSVQFCKDFPSSSSFNHHVKGLREPTDSLPAWILYFATRNHKNDPRSTFTLFQIPSACCKDPEKENKKKSRGNVFPGPSCCKTLCCLHLVGALCEWKRNLLGGWTNPSQKYARQKMDHFPQFPGWTFQKIYGSFQPPPTSIVTIPTFNGINPNKHLWFSPLVSISENLRLREVQGTNHHFFYSPVRFYSVSPFGGFLKWWVSPTTMGFFLLKMIILGCEMGVPPFKERPISLSRGKKTSSSKNEKLESRFINGGARCDFLRDLLFQCLLMTDIWNEKKWNPSKICLYQSSLHRTFRQKKTIKTWVY